MGVFATRADDGVDGVGDDGVVAVDVSVTARLAKTQAGFQSLLLELSSSTCLLLSTVRVVERLVRDDALVASMRSLYFSWPVLSAPPC